MLTALKKSRDGRKSLQCAPDTVHSGRAPSCKTALGPQPCGSSSFYSSPVVRGFSGCVAARGSRAAQWTTPNAGAAASHDPQSLAECSVMVDLSQVYFHKLLEFQGNSSLRLEERPQKQVFIPSPVSPGTASNSHCSSFYNIWPIATDPLKHRRQSGLVASGEVWEFPLWNMLTMTSLTSFLRVLNRLDDSIPSLFHYFLHLLVEFDRGIQLHMLLFQT